MLDEDDSDDDLEDVDVRNWGEEDDSNLRVLEYVGEQAGVLSV